jgi:hypothetical protein
MNKQIDWGVVAPAAMAIVCILMFGFCVYVHEKEETKRAEINARK